MSLNFLTMLKNITDVSDLSTISPRIGENFVKQINKKYQFVKFIAKGGEGIIILVNDGVMQRECILKVALPKLNIAEIQKSVVIRRPNDFDIMKYETEFPQRFARGCVLQQLMSKTIIDEGHQYGYVPMVYFYDKSPGLYCEMEYVRGESLMDWVKNRDFGEIIFTFYKMLKLIEDVLHKYNIVHSDLKPDNWKIMEGCEKPVLFDFNIAKNLASENTLTQEDTTLGSVLYASKTQRMNSLYRNYKDDIYTMGLVLHVMFRGHEPHALSKLVKPGEFVKTYFPSDVIPDKIVAIFGKATSDDEKIRYKDVSDFREDIEKVMPIFIAKKTSRMASFSDGSIMLDTIFPTDPENIKTEIPGDANNVARINFLIKAFIKAVWAAEDLRKL